MPLVGDILYRWRGDTSNLEQAQQRSNQVLDQQQSRLQQFAKVLKITGGLAAGVAVAGLLQYHGVLGKIGTATDKTSGIIKKLAVVTIGLATAFKSALSPLKTFFATIGTMAASGMNKLFAAFGSTSTVSTIGDKLKKSFQKMWMSALEIPKQAGEGLNQLGKKLYPHVANLSEKAAHLGHAFNTLNEQTYGVGGAIGKTAGAATAFAGALKGLQYIMDKLNMGPAVQLFGRMSAAIFSAVAAIAATGFAAVGSAMFSLG